MVTAPVELGLTRKANALEVAQTIGKAKRPSVICLHFQDCTGCSETLLRTSHPDVADLILNVISLDYHETLMAASGYQAEAALKQALADNFGKFVLVVEGSIPTKEQGRYMKLAGRPASEVLKDVGRKSAAVVADGIVRSLGRNTVSRSESHSRRQALAVAREQHRQRRCVDPQSPEFPVGRDHGCRYPPGSGRNPFPLGSREQRKIKNYQGVVPSTWNASPRDVQGVSGPDEASLLRNPLADPEKPWEVLRTIHSTHAWRARVIRSIRAERKLPT
jgi:hypothetical protein